jgi:hypothetical protein
MTNTLTATVRNAFVKSMRRSDVVTASTVRDVNNAPLRTRTYVWLLRRSGGSTAAAMRDAVGAYTCHNSWSLARLAATYGFRLTTAKRDDGLHYRFVAA